MGVVPERFDVILDGKVIFVGTNREIADHFGMKPSFRAGNLIKMGYKMQRIYNLATHTEDVKIVDDPQYEDIARQLKITPNTIVMHDKDRIVRKLARNGIKVRAELMSDKTGWVLWAV